MKEKQYKYVLLLTSFFIFTASAIFCGGNTEKTINEVITQTKNGVALFSDNGAKKENAGKQGDVLSSAGWLYSDIITVGSGFEYKLTATINVEINETQHNSDSDPEGSRVRIYLVPITNMNADFDLADAGGTALVTVSETNIPDTQHGKTDEGTAYYFTIPSSGETNFQTVFSVSEPTKIRIVIEKGTPVWENNSIEPKMAAMSVAVSNVSLGYNN